MSSLIVEQRFCGPPGYAHGGLLSGLIAGHSDRQLRVRLLQPVPLQTALEIHTAADGSVQLRQAQRLLARGEPAALQLAVPGAPGYLQALEASRGFIGFVHHAFPDCFACGTQRARGDGLRIFAGALPGGDGVAATWVPDTSLAGANGKVRPEFMTAALDCPGYFAARSDGVPMLLGEFAAHVDRCVHVDEPCIIIGWRIATSGRKYEVGTALFDEDGEPCARAHALWIEPRVFPRREAG
ncbi:MAG TPA: hypothetical protein VMD56_11770 [Steroidobacteraceae bacterium]|nr:hypothetical protein [Steroidobacteraceae bacterium]